jgi:long-chain acyl-CoA synthetase
MFVDYVYSPDNEGPMPGHALIPAATSLPEMVHSALERTANSAAFNQREAGYWRKLSTESFAQEIRRCCLGLVDLGLEPGDTVGVLAPSSPHWLVADLAIMGGGGVSVPLFPNLSTEHLLFESANVDLKYLIVIGEDQWRLAAPHAGRYRAVITKDVLDHPGSVLGWRQLLERGDALSERDPGLYHRLRSAVKPDDIATIIHTSGSTGSPKGVVLTHRNLVTQLRGSGQVFPLDPAQDRALSVLPLAHVFERVSVYTYLTQGVAVWFADDVKNTGILLREVKPTVMTMVPRLIEKLYARIVKQIDAAMLPKRQLGRWAVDLARTQDPLATRRWAMDVADAMVFRKLRGALGGQLRYLIVGGAALAPDLGRFLTNVGIPVYTGYGLTEASPVLTTNCPAANRLGSVGRPFPGVEVRIGAEAEILARGDNIMRGYHRDPAATAAAIDGDGWLHTGDCGRFDDDGYLVITGRIKELLKTSNGKYVCPVPIEQALTASKLVDQAMVVAEGRHFVTALLFPDLEFVRLLKEREGCAAMGDAEFLAGPVVQAEVAALLKVVNAGLDRWEQVKAVRFAPAPTAVGDELTPTMKLRRHVVAVKYRQLIEDLYQESNQSANSAS